MSPRLGSVEIAQWRGGSREPFFGAITGRTTDGFWVNTKKGDLAVQAVTLCPNLSSLTLLAEEADGFVLVDGLPYGATVRGKEFTTPLCSGRRTVEVVNWQGYQWTRTFDISSGTAAAARVQLSAQPKHPPVLRSPVEVMLDMRSMPQVDDGWMEFQFIIDERGAVGGLKFLQSLTPDLDRWTMDKLAALSFQPARERGTPVPFSSRVLAHYMRRTKPGPKVAFAFDWILREP